MQVKIKQEPEVFTPVTLEITFETEEEIEMLDDMLGWNISIPRIVYEHNQDKRTALQDLMTKIHDKMIEVREGQT